MLVNEVDKASAGSWVSDPYRPFYALLGPSVSRRFLDEFLQFEMDASAIWWVLAGNDLAPLPGPVRDRLIVIEVPLMSEAHLTAVVYSIYVETNAAMNGFLNRRSNRMSWDACSPSALAGSAKPWTTRWCEPPHKAGEACGPRTSTRAGAAQRAGSAFMRRIDIGRLDQAWKAGHW